MSTIKGRTWAMAAIPIFIGGIAAAPVAPVHAAPCSTWALPNQLELAQGDGWKITVPASGKATYTNPTNPDTSYGDRQGGLNGARLVMDIFWNNNSVGHYEADVTADGALVGGRSSYTTNGTQKHADTFTSNRLVCADKVSTPPVSDPNPQQQPPVGGAPKAPAPEEEKAPPPEDDNCIPDPFDLNFPGAC